MAVMKQGSEYGSTTPIIQLTEAKAAQVSDLRSSLTNWHDENGDGFEAFLQGLRDAVGVTNP